MKKQQPKPSANQHAVPSQNNPQHEDRVIITYYTDPLCCWSWGIEKSLHRLEKEFSSLISTTYIMGGLLRDWNSFNDPHNSITRPFQMGPVWMHAAELTQAAIQSNIWFTDPPHSSYPSCIAVKTAALQSALAERSYLMRAREAVMTRGLNIGKTEVLMKIAEEIAVEIPKSFSAEQFKEDWRNKAGCIPFEKDLNDVLFQKINRFPTLVISAPSSLAKKTMVGYQTYDTLKKELDSFFHIHER